MENLAASLIQSLLRGKVARRRIERRRSMPEMRGPPSGLSEPQEMDENGLQRATIRVEAFDTYGVIAAMVLSCAVSMFDNCDPTVGGIVQQGVSLASLVSLSVSVLSGAYTTLVFTMISLYSKTALGMKKDESFAIFSKETARHRQEGFYSFLACIASFGVAFCLSLITRMRHTPSVQLLIAGLCLFAIYGVACRLSEVMNLASRHIFGQASVTSNVSVRNVLGKWASVAMAKAKDAGRESNGTSHQAAFKRMRSASTSTLWHAAQKKEE